MVSVLVLSDVMVGTGAVYTKSSAAEPSTPTGVESPPVVVTTTLTVPAASTAGDTTYGISLRNDADASLRLLQSALDRPPDEQDEFLRQNCGGDRHTKSHTNLLSRQLYIRV